MRSKGGGKIFSFPSSFNDNASSKEQQRQDDGQISRDDGSCDKRPRWRSQLWPKQTKKKHLRFYPRNSNSCRICTNAALSHSCYKEAERQSQIWSFKKEKMSSSKVNESLLFLQFIRWCCLNVFRWQQKRCLLLCNKHNTGSGVNRKWHHTRKRRGV